MQPLSTNEAIQIDAAGRAFSNGRRRHVSLRVAAMLASLASRALPPGTRWNLRSSDETIAAARQAEAPPVSLDQRACDAAMDGDYETEQRLDKRYYARLEQRAARKVANARKQRRGWR